MTTRTDTVTGPQSVHAASASDAIRRSQKQAALWLRLGLVAGIAAGWFGLVKGWDLLGIGGASVAGACFLGLSIEAIPVWLWVVLGIGATLAVVGPSLWHLRLKHLPVTIR